jgi:hypothetical protein
MPEAIESEDDDGKDPKVGTYYVVERSVSRGMS